MPTIASGNEVEIYVPITSSVTVTPSGGYVDFGCASPSGTTAVERRKVYAAETLTVPAGSMMFMRAVGGSATYTDPAGLNLALQSLEGGAGNINAPLIIAEYAQQLTRSSVNGAGDTSFATMAAGGVTSSFVIPGGSMGPNGTMQWGVDLGITNTAVIVEFKLMIGGVDIAPTLTIAAGGANFYSVKAHEWTNTATGANKYRGTHTTLGATLTGWTTTAIDTTVDQTVDIVCRWQSAVSGGVVTLHRMRATVSYGA